MVVAFHAGLPLPGGFIGVDMFFVISGFVIMTMLQRQRERTGTISLVTFYTRRMRRLLPALAVLLVFVAVASTLLLSPFGPQQVTGKTGVAASLFSANFQLARAPGGGYFGLAAENNALLHTWSLSVEEQFYFVFPAFLIAAWWLGARFSARWSPQRTLTSAVLAVTTVSFGASCYFSFSSVASLGKAFAFYSPVTRAWEFGVGVLLALGAQALWRVTQRSATALGVAGALLICVGAFAISGTTAFPGIAALLPVIGTALVLVAGFSPNRGVTRALSMGPAVWVGDVSYGWYLWHWPLIVFAAAMWPRNSWILVVVAAGSLAPTWLSFRLIENPIRFNDRLTGRRIIPLVASCIALPIMAFLGLWLVNRIELTSGAVKTFSAATHLHSYGPSGCDSGTLNPESACTWPVDQPHGTIFLLGDSNAGQFAEPAAEAANKMGYNLTVGIRTRCPFVDVIRESNLEVGLDGPACHTFVTDSVTALRESPPALVVIAMASSQVVTVHDELYLKDPRSGTVATTPEAKAKLWEDGLVSVLAQLADAGIPTLVIHTVPHLGNVAQDWQAETCPAFKIYTDSCGASIDRANVEQQQQLAREAENRAIARVPGAASADFTNDLCSAESCAAERNGLWLYRDATHLSIDGALTLTDRFKLLIADHAAAQQ